jgi:hypothetical protein
VLAHESSSSSASEEAVREPAFWCEPATVLAAMGEQGENLQSALLEQRTSSSSQENSSLPSLQETEVISGDQFLSCSLVMAWLESSFEDWRGADEQFGTRLLVQKLSSALTKSGCRHQLVRAKLVALTPSDSDAAAPSASKTMKIRQSFAPTLSGGFSNIIVLL